MNREGTLGVPRPRRHVHPLILMASLLIAIGPQSLRAEEPPRLDVAAALAPQVFAVSPETGEAKPLQDSSPSKTGEQPIDFFAALAETADNADRATIAAPHAQPTTDFFSILAGPPTSAKPTADHPWDETPQSPSQLMQAAAGSLYSVLEKPSADDNPAKDAQPPAPETQPSDTQPTEPESAFPSNELRRIPLFGASLVPEPVDAVADEPEQVSRPMQQLTVNIRPGAGELPTNYAAKYFAQQEARGDQQVVWDEPYGLVYYWTAPGTSHRPLYFEEINLERYGWSHGHFFQPAVSAARFYGTIPALPYLFVAERHCECQYTLGYYRPGDCTPYQCHYPPFSVAGILAEGAAATGLVFLIP